MSVDMSLVKKLREQTGVGILECKKAIAEANNDFEKAAELLRKKGFEKAKSKSSRATKQGAIGSYIHTNRMIGVLVELGCETDFVARNEDFLQLQKDIAMQIAAMSPGYISEKDIPEKVIEKEKEIYREQMKDSGKPDHVIEKIIEGKLKKFYTEVCLLNQKFFRDDKKTIEALIAEKIHKLGENITVKRFVRYQVGEES
ncbi:MAG: translation elongation factor Ts [Candidatus Aminicenantes bacterium]|nr:translation elongation factor Ts [Candidatus Aminicenantes bacterium]NIM85159.1 translation elongation factor Ts [Candidatus Aminicenantes bacterium]NIN24671.1 translation elongation factor Ts [Candidatus Aminicenantes bacterium]NIN48432.1 translation elongation factor Ts [Candidatus Aminicenantes bacterium]NIN87662.1 translation elongation factor Ts [Candidatus Aminicenantes bacterium]